MSIISCFFCDDPYFEKKFFFEKKLVSGLIGGDPRAFAGTLQVQLYRQTCLFCLFTI